MIASVALSACTVNRWPLSSAPQPPPSAPALAPDTLPLVQAADVKDLGTFNVPATTANGTQLTYGSNALGMGADGQSLYFGCVYGGTVARISIPPLGGTATVLEECKGVPNLSSINPGDPNAKQLGGTLWWNGRLIITGFSFYDGAGTASKSHWAASYPPSQTPIFIGPVTLGPAGLIRAGMVGGYMGVIPPEWRALLGGPALTGQCCLSIISRTSYGPAVSVFDPDQIGLTNAATQVLGYPHEHQTLGPYDAPSTVFNATTRLGGVIFPAGTRSVLFLGRHGTSYCYGAGTSNQALHGTSHPQGGVWCYDPIDSDKGTHGYPYRHHIWAYDANDLVRAKNGQINPWDIKPYAVWIVGTNVTSATVRGATWDPATKRIYWTEDRGGAAPQVRVFSIPTATDPLPVPDVNCVETAGAWAAWSAWTVAGNVERRSRTRVWTQTTPKAGNGKACVMTLTQSPFTETAYEERPYTPAGAVDCVVKWNAPVRDDPRPPVCDATQTQTFRQTWTYVVVTPASNGGAACPVQPVIDRSDPIACKFMPPPPPVDCVFTTAVKLGEWLPTTCDATKIQTALETTTVTVTTPASGGGKACPADSTRSLTRPCDTTPLACVTAPLVVTVSAWPNSAEGTGMLWYSAQVAGATVTVKETHVTWGPPQRLTVIDSRNCSVTVTRP